MPLRYKSCVARNLYRLSNKKFVGISLYDSVDYGSAPVVEDGNGKKKGERLTAGAIATAAHECDLKKRQIRRYEELSQA